MILYTDKNIKLYCTKCKPPKLNVRGINMYDFIECVLNGKANKFLFSVKNNASFFYFQHEKQWYRTEIATYYFDVMDYIMSDIGYFSTEKFEVE